VCSHPGIAAARIRAVFLLSANHCRTAFLDNRGEDAFRGTPADDQPAATGAQIAVQGAQAAEQECFSSQRPPV
jgi:hypothetical protein